MFVGRFCAWMRLNDSSLCRLEEDGLWEEAAESYKEAIADDGSHGVARDKLKRVQELLERKVGMTGLLCRF